VRHHLLPHKAQRRDPHQASHPAGPGSDSLSRRSPERRTGTEPGLLACRRDSGHRRDKRLRHGHRQAGRPLRHPLQHARRHGGLLSGGRTRRAGRSSLRLHPPFPLPGHCHQ